MKYSFNMFFLLSLAAVFSGIQASADERDNFLLRQAQQLAISTQGVSYGHLSPSPVFVSLAARINELRSEARRLRRENDALKSQLAHITSASASPVHGGASSSSPSSALLSVTPSDAVTLSQSAVFESIPVHINRIIAQANQLRANKEFPAALRLLDNTLLLSGLLEQDRAHVLALIGDIYFTTGHETQGDYQLALEYYDRVLKLNASPKIRSSALAHKGIIHFSQQAARENGYDEALQCFEKISNLDELPKQDKVEVLIRMAVIYQTGCASRPSKYYRALECSQAAYYLPELRPSDRPAILVRMGDMFFEGDATIHKNYQMALKYYRNALLSKEVPATTRARVEQAINDCNAHLTAQNNSAQQHVASTSSGASSSSSSSSSSSAYQQAEDDEVQIISVRDANDQLPRTSAKRAERTAISAVARESQPKRSRVEKPQPFCGFCRMTFLNNKGLVNHYRSKNHLKNAKEEMLRLSIAQSAQEDSETDTDNDIPALGSEE